MKHYTIHIALTDELVIKKLNLIENTTGLPNDVQTLEDVCTALLKSIIVNKEDLITQDLMAELGFARQPEE